MTAFIRQEANEKASEIKIKADQEFSIEKSKLVQEEKDAIDSAYDKKFKQATMSQQITRSKVANQTRLKVLGARQELLDDIFEAASSKLGGAAEDKEKYGSILKNLILEGFYEMDEPRLKVRARQADYQLVQSAIEAAAKEYKETVGKEISAEIDESEPVPEERYVITHHIWILHCLLETLYLTHVLLFSS